VRERGQSEAPGAFSHGGEGTWVLAEDGFDLGEITFDLFA